MELIAVLLAGAAGAHALARWLRMPAIPFLLLTGALLASLGPLDSDQLLEPLTLGVIFLLFVGGTELNVERVGRQRRSALRVGAVQFFLLGGAGFAMAQVLGFGVQTGLYLALALTASSTLVVVRLLQRRQQFFDPLGRLVLGVLLLQDLLVIALVPIVAGAPEGWMSMLRQLAGTAALMALTYGVVRWAGNQLSRLRDDEEGILLVTLAILFGFVAIAAVLRVPLVSGAFLAGVALSRFPVSGLVRGQLGPITDFFAAIFFTALGGLLSLPSVELLVQAVAFSALVVLLTPPIVAFVAERAGFSARPALEAGLVLSQTSELSLVVALQGMLAGHIGVEIFSLVAMTTALTMLLTPLLATDRVTRWLLRLHPMRRESHVLETPRDHVVLFGCGASGMPLLETLLSGGHQVVVVDDDPAVVSRLREGGVPSIRGDAADSAVLQDAGVASARIVSSTVRQPRDNRLLLESAGKVPVLVRVFDDGDADWVRALGGTPIVAAEAATSAFLSWFERRFRGKRGPESA